MSNAASYPLAMLPVTGTTFVARPELVSTLSVSSVVGSTAGVRVLEGAAPLRTVSLAASVKKIWVV